MPHPEPHRQSLAVRTRTARIAVSGGSVAGVCIFLTEEDLRDLNIDLHEISNVRYSIDVETRQVEVAEYDSSEVEHGRPDQ